MMWWLCVLVVFVVLCCGGVLWWLCVLVENSRLAHGQYMSGDQVGGCLLLLFGGCMLYVLVAVCSRGVVVVLV